MIRASALERSQRINMALDLLKKDNSPKEVVSSLVAEFVLSTRQASTSSQDWQTARSSGAQNGFHRQAAARCRSARAADCSRAPSVHQRFGHRSIGGFPDKTQTPWLSPTADEPSMFNSNAAMIVIPCRSWRKFIGFSSLAMSQAAKLRNL